MKFPGTHIMWRRMTELLSNCELERMWKEAVMALFVEALVTEYLPED
jgi:hypothetical protein